MSWLRHAGVELTLAAVSSAIVAATMIVTRRGASLSWCDHEPHTRYVGHVVVDHGVGEGIAPAYRCARCLREWLGAVEPLRRPLVDVALERRTAGRSA